MTDEEDSVIRYINSDDQFALQIDGAWGVGKTYFIKNKLLPLIKKSGNSDSLIKDRYIPIYISLNGITKISTVKNQMYNTLIKQSFLNGKTNSNNKKVMRVLDFFGDNFTSAVNKGFLSKIDNGYQIFRDGLIDNFFNKNIILIFDELERSNLIKPNEILGLISSLIEKSMYSNKFKCKIIISVNEAKYIKYNDKFRDIKEKVVNKTIHFGNNSKETANELLLNHIMKIINQYFNINLSRDWIFKVSNFMMSNLTDINLRTIWSFIYTFKELCQSINKIIKNNSHINKDLLIQLLKTGYISIFTLTDAIKRNKDDSIEFNKRYNDITFIKKHLGTIRHYRGYSYQITGGTYLDKTFLKYTNHYFDENILYTKVIYNLVAHDEFNNKDVNRYIQNVRMHFYDRIMQSHVAYEKLFKHFRSFNDSQIQFYEMNIIKSLKGHYSSIQLIDLVSIYSFLYYLKKHNLCKFYLNMIFEDIVLKAKSTKIQTLKIIMEYDGKMMYPMSHLLRIYIVGILGYKKHMEPIHKAISHVKLILHGKTYDDELGDWFKDVSFIKIILTNKRLVSEVFKVPGVINLQNYIKYQMSANYLSKHKVELKDNYMDKFIDILTNYKNYTKSNINKYNYMQLLNTIKIFKKEIKNSPSEDEMVTN